MLLTPRFWLGALVTLGFLFLFLWKVDFGETWKVLQGANYAYFVPAVLVYFVALGLRCVRWRYLLLHLKSVPPWRLYPVVAIGYLANNILPMRLGELVRAHFLGEKEGISKASGLATIGVERVFDGLTLLFFVVIVWPFLPWTEVLKDDPGELDVVWLVLGVLVAIFFVAAFIILFLIAASPGFGRGSARLLSSVSPPRLRPKVDSFVYLLIEGLGSLRSPRKLVIISILSGPVWLTEAVTYYIIAISFDLGLSFSVILLVTATSNLATAVPSSIGGIGPFEIVAKTTLVAFGLAAEPAAAYTFFVHIVALWLPVNILGLFFLGKENLSLSQLAKRGRADLAAASQTQGSAMADYGNGSMITKEGEGSE